MVWVSWRVVFISLLFFSKIISVYGQIHVLNNKKRPTSQEEHERAYEMLYKTIFWEDLQFCYKFYWKLSAG